jgi:hypothetical protein
VVRIGWDGERLKKCGPLNTEFPSFENFYHISLQKKAQSLMAHKEPSSVLTEEISCKHISEHATCSSGGCFHLVIFPKYVNQCYGNSEHLYKANGGLWFTHCKISTDQPTFSVQAISSCQWFSGEMMAPHSGY